MKLILLDFDGVLNNSTNPDVPYWALDPTNVAVLNTLIERTGAKVVVTSSWRTGAPSGPSSDPEPKVGSDGVHSVAQMQAILEMYSFKGEVVDVAPLVLPAKFSMRVDRGEEIMAWLKSARRAGGLLQTEAPNKFVILDDRRDIEDYEELREHFVRTKMKTGLLPEHIELAVRILT